MYITKPGAYLALCDHYLIMFRAVGAFPYLKIPTGIILNDYSETGEFRYVTENSPEIQGIYTLPEKFVFSSITDLAAGVKGLNFENTARVEFEAATFEKYSQRLRLIDAPRSGLAINSLATELMFEFGYSLPQAHMFIQELRKRLKEKAQWPYQL